MADHSMQRSPGHSFIPIVTPRPSRSSISTGLPVPQVSLGPQLRRASESSLRASPASTPTTPGPQTPQSSIPSFRSLRNLLPFGPSSKNASNGTPSPNTPKASFVGTLRRSITHERKSSATFARSDIADKSPVIAIARPSETFEEDMMAHKRGRDQVRSASDPSRTSSGVDDDRYVLPVPSPGPPLGADLSTIIEAENSGISKHIPCLDDTAHPDSHSSSPESPFSVDKQDISRLPSPGSRDGSVLELSTSKLDAEVMHALMVKDATMASEWLKGADGVVVDENAEEHTVQQLGGEVSPDAAFEFGALDPDLAQLLSPHRLNGKSNRSVSTSNIRPPRTHPRTPNHSLSSSPHIPSTERKTPSTSPRLGTVIPPSPVSRTVAHSSPQRRSVSLSRTTLARPATSSLPRPTRSVTTTPTASPAPKEAAGTASLHGPPKKRCQPPSPLSVQAHSTNGNGTSPASSRTSTDLPSRRPLGSRLGTMNRHVSSYTPSSSRTDLPPTPDNESSPPSSQTSSRTVSDNFQQQPLRPSLDLGGPLEVNKRRRAHLFSNRKRSMSVEEARLSPTSGSSRVSPIRPSSSLSNRPPVMEWLGPRTAKAFAAAGLLDGDRDGMNLHGRYGSSRGNNEREDRFVPSRMAFSEAASSSSWGRRGSISRVMTPSDGGVTWAGSPTFSAPRTTFSGGSTAPTSISVSSSAQQAALQLMKEKHDLETEALLAALSDSQRTSKTLREENTQLRDRIQELEDELEGLRDQLRRLANGLQPPQSSSQATVAKPTLDRKMNTLANGLRPPISRGHSRLHMHSNGSAGSSIELGVNKCDLSPSRAPAFLDTLPRPNSQRRGSVASSVFPSLPNNMSLLMLEEAVHDRGALSSSSVSPPSPSRCLPKWPNGSSVKNGHFNQPPMSSMGNISPATADFSMTEIPGSPSSLQLRPEHELHLGDMASLSLYGMSDDDEGQHYDL
ncbi:hypothetical protein ID866_6470 [Astraeus odoratus]|nr:hypothetical protein ID866_6470 [Astraeus odoratus]